jgi:hypothetical protein
MAVSYTKPTEIPQATWNQISWSFDTGSNHPVFHGQNPEGTGTESHPIIKTITYYFTVKDGDGDICFPTQEQVNGWAYFLSSSGVDMDGNCEERFKTDAIALSTNNGNGVHYATSYESAAVELVRSS